MSKETVKYLKLPGSGFRESSLFVRGGRVTLWLGDDHLLMVESDGYKEQYKRFYFKDIQGVTIRRTVDGKVVNFLLGLPLFFLCLGALSSKDTGAIASCLFFGFLFLVFLVINVLRGPTCKTMLITAVQTERMATMGRLKTARKVLNRVQPLITVAQGELKAEEMAAAIPAGESPAFAGNESFPVPEVPYRGKTHLIMAWVALADVAGTALVSFMNPDLSRLYTLIHILALIILGIMAMNKQKNTTLPVGLKRLPMVLLAGVIGCFALTIVLSVYFAISDRHSVETMRENTLGTTWQVVMMVVSTSINGLGGLYGVVKFRRYQQSLQAVTPPPAVPPVPPPPMDLPA